MFRALNMIFLAFNFFFHLAFGFLPFIIMMKKGARINLKFSEAAADNLFNLGREILGEDAVCPPNHNPVDHAAHFF